MSHLATLPLWAAILIALFLLTGSILTLLGAIGLTFLKSFYDRLHAPALGTSWGTTGIIIASMLLFTVTGDRAVLHEFLIGFFVMITTPITMLLLGRAALQRDRVEKEMEQPESAKSGDPAERRSP